ncbi:MAG: DMT family transporter [Candidatus Nezhaarchaeota archaeon]|nr:DMT family transporter [Candidatus Nezhaarchaeota archaeon]
MIGTLAALLASSSWALAALLYRKSVAEVQDPLITSWLRVPLALCFTATLSWGTGRLSELPALLHEGWGLAWIILATTLAIVLGDALYIVSLREAGVSIGYPVGYTYPLYASLFAIAFIGEQATVSLAIGLALALTGIWTASFNPPRELGRRERVLKGVLAAILAGVCWGLGSVVYRVAVYAVDPINVNLVKLIYLFIAMAPFAWRGRFRVSRRGLQYALLGGLVGLGIGDWLFYVGLSIIGVSRTVTLTTISPLLSLVLAKLLLHEPAGARQALGALLIVAGVYIATRP